MFVPEPLMHPPGHVALLPQPALVRQDLVDDRREGIKLRQHRRFHAPISRLLRVPQDRLPRDRGYDADWFRETFKDKGVRARIPGGKRRNTPAKYDKRRYKPRNHLEIKFGRFEDWRGVATRFDRLPRVLLSAITLAGALSR